MKQVSVIIPAFNEEKTISEVIKLVQKSNKLLDIIVVDNGSTDQTSTISNKLGARVEKCYQKGKGYAMETGLKAAKGDIVVFLDADITDYSSKIIDLLVNPIIKEDIDFVKSTFERTQGGMVTEIAVKPLLELLFPEVYPFSEPISGMIAAKREILEQVYFEKDYGVDIGILLDVIQKGYKVKEVNIGKIENMSHVLKTKESMKAMSTQIIKAILKRKKIN